MVTFSTDYLYCYVCCGREDLPQLKYLTLCIKESLRIYPPVPAIQRQITKPLTIKGVTFPVGQVFTLVINNLHHNPHIWENPTVRTIFHNVHFDFELFFELSVTS
jgi:hypothetical protein